jgi:hypothetical protein
MTNEEQLQLLLSMFLPQIQNLALRARELVLGIFPQAVEQVDLPAKLIGYGYDRSYKGLVCGIALQRSYVNLMFSRGVDLPDPEGLLEGTGKRARHVKIQSEADLENPAVASLLRAALEL